MLESGRGLLRFGARVPAGFTSPADDYIQDRIDLNHHLFKHGHESATFILRVEGWPSMTATRSW